MKKLLSILLATATVFSTTAFANPAAEPIESADEISLEVGGRAVSSKISDASLAEETATKVDALAPLYGINLIDENFESFTVGETYGTQIHGGRLYATEGGKISGVLVENENVDGVGLGSGKYIKLNIGDMKLPVFRTVLGNGLDASTGERVVDYVSVPAKFTASIKMYFADADFAKAVATSPALRKGDGKHVRMGSAKFGAGAWNTLTKTYSQTESGITVRELLWIFDNPNLATGTIYIDDIKLYYKPLKEDKYSGISFNFPTITVTAENGFEANAVAAMKANPAEYLTDAVKSVDFSGNKMIITLNEDAAVNHSSIIIPELVNAKRSATYGETIVNIAAVAPTSLAEETAIRATYPAGLRFKAAVKTEFMGDESLTEFGYIVARADKLTESGLADLTIGIDQTKLKTIESQSFKRVDGNVAINKSEVGSNVDYTTFAAVLVNIPSTNYGDEFAVRPYVVYGGEYYYGDTMKESILKVAQSLKDGGATGDVLEVVNKIINGEALPEYKG